RRRPPPLPPETSGRSRAGGRAPRQAPRLPRRDRGDRNGMQISKDLIIQELEKQGKSEHVQKALDELPEKVDHEQHAAMLEKLGLDPGKLAEDAAKKGLAA